MFEDSLIESTNRIKTRRPWTTVLSFFIQACIVGLLVLIPLLVTQALPTKELTTFLVAPPPPPPPPPPAAAATKAQPTKPQVVKTDELTTPVKIPQKVVQVKETEVANAAPPTTSAVVGGVPGGMPGGQIGGVVGGVLSSVPASVPKIAAPQKVRVSQGVSQGLLVHKVTPTYPPLARSARVQGTVVLQAVIDKEGKVTGLRIVQGHPMLASAAIDAVKQWRYKPYVLNGQPVEVETTINVNFSLSGA